MRKVIFALIMLIIAMGAAGAGDFNATVHASFDEDAIYISDADSGNDLLELSASQEDAPAGSKDSTPATFNELQRKITNAKSGSTITLSKDYLYDDEFSDAKGIKIAKPITIDGQGHEIDGSFDSPIFIIKSDNVVLKNLTLKNGYNENAGAVSVYSNHVKFINCSFLDNQASFDNGGAIYLDRCRDISFTSCIFKYNFAFFDGGAVLLDHCRNFSFTDCYFSYYDDIYLNYCSDFTLDSCTYYLYVSKQLGTVRSTIFIKHCKDYSIKSSRILEYIDNSTYSNDTSLSDERDNPDHHGHHTNIFSINASMQRRYSPNRIGMLISDFSDIAGRISGSDNQISGSADVSKSIQVEGIEAYDYRRLPVMVFSVFLMLLILILGYGKAKS